MAAVDVTLAAFAAERRGRRSLLSPARRAGTQQQTHCCGRSTGQTVIRTDTRPLHRPCSAYYADSVKNINSSVIVHEQVKHI